MKDGTFMAYKLFTLAYVITGVIYLMACNETEYRADIVEDRDGSPFEPGCMYDFIVEEQPIGCVQKTALCLDETVIKCTGGNQMCLDAFNQCIADGQECMKETFKG